MPWVRIDDQFPQHPKVVGVGPLGLALQVAGLCYCNRYLTDGFIPKAAVGLLLDFSEVDTWFPTTAGEPPSWQWIAERLVTAKLWKETPEGYQIHDYLEYQLSKANVLKEREATKLRQHRFKEGKKGNAVSNAEVTPLVGGGNAVSNAAPNPNPNPNPNPTVGVPTVNPPIVPLEGDVSFILPDWVDAAAWADFLEMRKKAKAVPTSRAMKLLITQLDKLRADGNDPKQVLEQSTMNSYKGVFPITRNGGNNGRTPTTSNGETVRERKHREFLEEAERFKRTGSPVDRQRHVPSVQPVAPN